MQKFTLHTHNSELDFDGRNTAFEMIQQAQLLGFETIGVSNHMIVNELLDFPPSVEPMFFKDFKTATKCYKRHIEILENLKDKFKINIKIGFECDFFEDKNWRNSFEKMLKELPIDYLIGSNHFIRNDDETYILNIYHLQKYQHGLTQEQIDHYTINYYKNTASLIRSGYFSFIAHMDYCTIFNLGEDSRFEPYKIAIIDALKETKTPLEINTSGFNRINRPHPDPKYIKLLDNSIPLLISDDAHSIDRLGNHFEKTEDLLKSYNYTNRFTLDMLKKPI